jgi:hypothetical protein
MPLYMDVHDHLELPASTPVSTEPRFGVRRLRRWFDNKTGRTFFLIDAPNRDAAVRLHREVHQAEGDTLVEVREDAW